MLDAEGRILDGRNRYAACELAGVEPHVRWLNGEDLNAFVISANVHRRNVSKGQKAMAVALIYPEAQHGGTRKKGSSSESKLGFSKVRLAEGRAVLRYSPELAHAVRDGTKPLGKAELRACGAW